MALVGAEACLTQDGVPLLLAVLPPLLRIARHLEAELDKTEQDLRNFYIYFEALSRLLLYDLLRLHKTILIAELDSCAHELLNQLERVIEQPCVPQSAVPQSPYYQRSFWKIRILGDCWACRQSEEELFEGIHSFISFGTHQQRNELIDTLKRFSEEINLKYPDNYVPQADFQPPRRYTKEPSYEVWGAASSIFEAVTDRLSCNCPDVHDYVARLALATYRGSKDIEEKIDFEILFCLDPAQQKWKEAQVRAVISKTYERSSGVQFVIDRPDKPAKSGTPRNGLPQRQRVTQICAPIKKSLTSKLHRLNLEVENGELYKTQSTKDVRFSAEELEQPVSLGGLISSGATGLGDKVKRVLAVILGYAVLHLHGGSWLGPTWSKDDVFFIKSASAIPLRPYVFTRLNKTQVGSATTKTEDGSDDELDADPDDFPLHPYPDLVILGTMLIELHMAKPIEVLAVEYGIEQDENINAKWSVADEVFKKIWRDVPDNYRDAINTCLDPNFGSNLNDPRGSELHGDDLRRLIYSKIVKLLEDELDQGFGRTIDLNDLDSIAQTLDFGSWGQTFQQQVAEPSGSQPLDPFLPPAVISSPRHSSTLLTGSISSRAPQVVPILDMAPRNEMLMPHISIKEPSSLDFELFDDITGPRNTSAESCKLADEWMRMMRNTYESFVMDDLEERPRVKIAILDTGIDLEHPDMEACEGRIKSVRSWVDGKNGEEEDSAGGDESGHGTHTTGIILDVAPDADIYVARVALTGPSYPSQIAKAVIYAATVWKVDIISMSFGFPRRVPGYEDFEQAINDAEHLDILIFAAASNEGGNRKRAYPARHDKVICIHSTDGQGNPSDSNPTPLKNRDNFSTLGEAVRSAWPVALCDAQTNSECTARKSGTSFATPIAAGIAAFLLQYARLNLTESEAHLLKRVAGMKAVFNLIVENRRGYGYVAPSLAPDNFFGKGEQYVRVNMAQAINNS